MIIDTRVHNSEGKTVGFLVENRFYRSDFVERNISKYENMRLRNGEPVSTKNSLSTITLMQWNKQRYEALVLKKAPFVRDIQTKMNNWRVKAHRSNFLYLKGVRQVGKTSELLKFGYMNYENVIYVNLIDEQVLECFLRLVVNNMTDMYGGMQEFCKVAGYPEYTDTDKTLLILDEIQANKTVYNKLRMLNAELNCDLAVTGSYLGVAVREGYFIPTGSCYMLTLYPLSFSEFCRVFNKEIELRDLRFGDIALNTVYRDLTKLYTAYLQVGGFPAVVQEYKQYGLEGTATLLNTLITCFSDESSYYLKDSKSKMVFDSVFKAIIRTLLSEKKGASIDLTTVIIDFVKADSNVPVSSEEINGAMSWLYSNGLLNCCYMYNKNKAGKGEIPGKRYYFIDTGLTYALLGSVISLEAERKGILAETFVFNELCHLCREDARFTKLPYFSIYQNYELDFFLQDTKDKFYGVEVKSKHTTSPKSLLTYLNKRYIDRGIVAEITKGGVGKEYTTIPIYAIGVHFPFITED